MSLLRRRTMMRGAANKAGILYFGDTPVISSSNNQNYDNIATLPQPEESVFNYILFLSKDRRAYKQIAYTQNTIEKTIYGKINFDASPYSEFVSNAHESSFILNARTYTSSIIVGHGRMKSISGDFYTYFPQKFEVYGLLEPYEEGDIP